MVDILLVRMTSDINRPPEKRYNYSNAIGGLIELIKSEGVRGLFRGLGTNTVRDEPAHTLFKTHVKVITRRVRY